jgi:hypothetical protein
MLQKRGQEIAKITQDTLHTANTTGTLKGQAEERKRSSEACKTCSMPVQRPSLRQIR